VSKPIEDPPSLVDILAREHAARRALIEAEAARPFDKVDTEAHVNRAATQPTIALDVAVDDRGTTQREARGTAPVVRIPEGDTRADIGNVRDVADGGEVAPTAPPIASSPRILVDKLSRQCAERRAALDDEAKRS
jgi:hypothetical protein